MKRTVLVVEDNTELSAGLADALDELGFGVECANDGVVALELLRTQRPAMIVLDLLMPRMNGVEFLKIRKRDPVLAKIPVIILSGDENLLGSTSGLSANVILKKPVHLLMLVDAIRRLGFPDGDRENSHVTQG